MRLLFIEGLHSLSHVLRPSVVKSRSGDCGCENYHICVKYDVIKWKHFPRYWPFVWGIHRSPMNSPHKGQWRGDLMFSLICTWINDWVNNRDASDLRRHRAHFDVTVMMRQAFWQHLCQISERPHNLKTTSCGSEVAHDLVVRRLTT